MPLSSSLGSLAWQSTKQPRRSPTSLNYLARITENGTLDRALELLSCRSPRSRFALESEKKKRKSNEELFCTAYTRDKRSIVRRCNGENVSCHPVARYLVPDGIGFACTRLPSQGSNETPQKMERRFTGIGNFYFRTFKQFDKLLTLQLTCNCSCWHCN